jgi:hypothetical protein
MHNYHDQYLIPEKGLLIHNSNIQCGHSNVEEVFIRLFNS